MGLSEDSVTILKYRIQGVYGWYIMDKHDESDEPTRLDKMIAFSAKMAEMHIGYEELWIKTCPIFPTRQGNKHATAKSN